MNARTLLVSLLAGLVLGPAAFGAAPPPPPAPAVLAMSSNPDEAARKSIQAFVDHHMGVIETGTPDQVKESRNALVGMLRKGECTLVFYRTFMQLATPSIEKALGSGDGFRAVNALRVVAQVKCSEAMDLMLAQGAAGTQKDAPVRIASAAMVATMVKFGAVPAAELDSVSRRIRENVEAETVALAASQDMMALGAVASKAESDKMTGQVRGALDELVKATTAAAGRAAEAGGGDFNAAVFRGLIAIRDVCVKLPNAEQASVAPAILPVIEKVEALPADADAKSGPAQRELGAAKAVCEALRGMLGTKGAAKK